MGYTDEEMNHVAVTRLSSVEQTRTDKIADNLRMRFIHDWAVNGNLDLYKSEVERDWAYIVRREYRWIVQLRSWGDAAFVGSLFQCGAIFYAKKFVAWPLLAVPVVALARQQSNFRNTNRRLFEMLNIGSEFELGAERNRVLEECNRICERNDF